jgi:hypothetical protein
MQHNDWPPKLPPPPIDYSVGDTSDRRGSRATRLCLQNVRSIAALSLPLSGKAQPSARPAVAPILAVLTFFMLPGFVAVAK